MKLRIDDRGATAIEYGLIAGLIAIGIVGTLVGTRGSLNSAYGTVSSQLGSSTKTVTVDQGLKSVFAAKTITGRQSQQYNMDRPGYGSQNDFLLFSDGSQAYRTTHFAADGSDQGYYEYYMTDKGSNGNYNFYTDKNGNTTYIISYKTAPPYAFNGYIYYYPGDATESVSNSDKRSFYQSGVTSDITNLLNGTGQDAAFMNFQIAKKL